MLAKRLLFSHFELSLLYKCLDTAQGNSGKKNLCMKHS